ncbi:MAG: hypothetical protein ACYCS1_08810, partial [Gammaproteobacteria bacterium]
SATRGEETRPSRVRGILRKEDAKRPGCGGGLGRPAYLPVGFRHVADNIVRSAGLRSLGSIGYFSMD